MEHAAHVWYHERVDGLEAKGWTRTSVFMRRLVIDAQAVVLYMAVCVLIFVIDLFTQGTAERLASPPYRYFYAKSPRSWLCLVAHVVAHKDWAHLKTNMINLLLVGPAAEREFGTQQVAVVGVVVAVASALAHMAFGHSHSGQLGGSGVVSVCVETNQCVGCENSSLSHFAAVTRPSWFGRAARNRHRHAIEQASRRWRGGRRDDLAQTRRKFDFHTGLGADPPQFIGRGVIGPRAPHVPADGGVLALGRGPVHSHKRRREPRRAPRGGPRRHGRGLRHPREPGPRETRPEPPRERPLRPDAVGEEAALDPSPLLRVLNTEIKARSTPGAPGGP